MSEKSSKKGSLFGWFKKKKPEQEGADEAIELQSQVVERGPESELELDKETSEVSGLSCSKNETIKEPDAGLDQSESASLDESLPVTATDDTTAVITIVEEETAKPEKAKQSFFQRLKAGLSKTRSQFSDGLANLVLGQKAIDDDILEEVETLLLMADVGVDTTTKIIDDLTEKAARKELKDTAGLMRRLKTLLYDIIKPVQAPLEISTKQTPFVILMVGVNGVGKTTTIGKLAHQFIAEGKSVMLAAGDTFRAAAVEQLQTWGERNNVPVIAQHTGADSASVIFDAVEAAKARDVDIVIADTAGRLHNKAHLMEELGKIKRVVAKIDADAPHEVMLVVDACTGQNALVQAVEFDKIVSLSSVTITKLDGTAKGGVIFALADKMGLPIRYIGVGESKHDLRAFNAADYIEALFAQ